MLDDLFHFAREGLAARRSARIAHRSSSILDEEFCEQYARAARDSDFRVLQAYLLDRALASLPRQGEALDVGCGPGVLLAEFVRHRPAVHFTGLDLSPAILRQARLHLHDQGIANVRLVCADMGQLANVFPERSFDWISWTFGLHYCTSPAQALSMLDDMARLLRPGGGFFLADLVRFRRESTREWFANKYDRAYGERFFREIRDSYLAAFSADELADLLQRSRLTEVTLERSRLFPVLMFAYTGSGRTMRGQTRLTAGQRTKHAILRRLFALSAVRSGF